MSHTYREIRNNPKITDGYKGFVPLRCNRCQIDYQRTKKSVNKRIRDDLSLHNYCDDCKTLAQIKTIDLACSECEAVFQRRPSTLLHKNKKSDRSFCSQTCSGRYNNRHKATGSRRSKIEAWIEAQLIEMYPDLVFHFNRKDAIGSELDIFVPELKLAFELNGIFHYEPIYGPKKLDETQANDGNKFQACQAAGISLCVIDTSGQKYFKPTTSQRFLDIIMRIVETELNRTTGQS